MDQLGEVVRRYLAQARRDAFRRALVLAEEMQKDGYQKDHVAELLAAQGISEDVISAALQELDFK